LYSATLRYPFLVLRDFLDLPAEALALMATFVFLAADFASLAVLVWIFLMAAVSIE
jgi:hypothetical protein